MRQSPRKQVPPEIRRVLRRLRRRVRRYIVLEGLALVICLLAVLFWVSLGLDWAYFRLSSLELPVWFRKAFAIGTLCLFVFSFLAWVALRSLRRLRMKALALVLERRFPELGDRLITAVEWSESRTAEQPPLTTAMLNQTVEEAARAVRSLEIGAVFNRAPLRRAVLLAAVLVASIGGLVWANEHIVNHWQRAYLNWEDRYWNRQTVLVMKVVAQPNDRVKEFRDFEYKHPRGADLTLLAEVPEGKQPPEQVRLEYRLADGRGGGNVRMARIGDGRFRHSIGHVLDSMNLWVRGGDFINRRAYRVTVVDPPELDQVQLQCDYPDYTGLNETAETDKPVQGAQVSLPMETRFQLEATANKPLRSVRIQTNWYEVRIQPGSSQLVLFSRDGEARQRLEWAPETSRPLLETGSRRFRLPMVVTSGAVERIEQLEEPQTGPLPLPPDSLLRLYLHDHHGITSLEPARLTINGIVDQPPVVETELRGIGNSITRQAVIPVAGTIADDYGLTESRFDFRLGEQDDWQPRPFSNDFSGRPEEWRLGGSGKEPVEKFQVLPLDLSVGQKLTLTVYARDGDNLNGPHATRGRQYAFQIVSAEELLSILYGKEVNLRRRFERIIEEIEETRTDLEDHRQQAAEARKLRSSLGDPNDDNRNSENNDNAEARQKLSRLEKAVAATAERSLHQIRKNANETAAIEESFRDIFQELVNNRVHTSQMVERINGLIIDPLHRINTVDYPALDESLGRFRLAQQREADVVGALDKSVQEIDTLLAHMQEVLAEMRDLAEFHEVLKNLKSIIEAQQELTDETQNKRKKSLIEDLQDLKAD